MSTRGLQILVGKAVISETFRAGLLNGRRAELIQGFDLEPQERAAVLSIQADTLADFAAQIEQLVNSLQAGPSHAQLGTAREAGGERVLGRGGDWAASRGGFPIPS